MEIADTIIINGRVITVNARDELARAVAVKGTRILAVGGDEISALADKNTRVIDARGGTVMPGFIDAHIHFGSYGVLGKAVIDISQKRAPSIADIRRIIREAANRKAKGEWIKLKGYDQNRLAEKRHPTIRELDEAAPDNPVQCSRICSHMSVYNTAALKIAGITSPSQFPPGEIETDGAGNLTGLLRESANMYAKSKALLTDEELDEGVRAANRDLLSCGVTSVHEAGWLGAPSFLKLRRAMDRGDIDIRLYPMIFDTRGKKPSADLIRHYIETGLFTGLGDEHYRLGPVKLMLDGGASTPSGAGQHRGNLIWSPEETEEIVLAAHKAGFQVTAHAIGDMAVDMMVTAIEKALEAHPRQNHRHRIEHCFLTDAGLIGRIARAGIIPVSNPAFIARNGQAYNHIYGERADSIIPLRGYLEHGVISAAGSDAPIAAPNPMLGLFGALTRRDLESGEAVGGSQKIGLMDAVRMFTYNGAYASFEENLKGSLEPGKLADIVVLSEDILACSPERIMGVEAEHTMIGGKVLYSREN